MLKCEKVTVEYRENPIGIDEKKPRFSWKAISSKAGSFQKAYRVTVSRDGEIVWDSTKVESQQSALVEYEGEELEPLMSYDTVVEIWDDTGESSKAETRFETGFMTPQNIKAEWITHSDEFEDGACPVFKKTFHIPGEVKKARIYATALGIYDIMINGQRLSDEYFSPGWTSYDKRLQYQTYDATDMMENIIEVEATVANGWYRNFRAFMDKPLHPGRRLAFMMELHLEYTDGKREVLVTDGSWEWSGGEVRYTDIYNGETVDRCFSGYESKPVRIHDHRKDHMTGQECEPVRIVETIPAKELIRTPRGETVMDFGQNLTGFVSFSVKGEKGHRIKIRHAEVLDRDGNFYTANLRTAKAEDVFICSGERETFMPRFTFHGFRYIMVEGMGENPDIKAFEACVLHSDMEETGYFECSDEMVNRLWQNIRWGQKGNFLGVPTDCPQRDERLGWTGDAQVFAGTAAFNMNVALFMAKWLKDLEAEQTESGIVPFVVPNVLDAGGGEKASAAWGDAAVIVPWTMYRSYGDKRFLERQYCSMKAWVEHIRKTAGKSMIWKGGSVFGDWLGLDMEQFFTTNRGHWSATGSTDKDYIATAFYAYSTELLANAAKVLGYEEDEKEYGELHGEILKAFDREYVTETGRLVSETQTALLLALKFGLVDSRHRGRVVKSLEENIKKHGGHMVAGFVGSSYMCPVLTEEGMHDMAGSLLLKKEYPSYLYPVTKGATTIWERWNGIKPDGEFETTDMNSFNHYAYGAVGDWMHRKLLGIDMLEPGYRKILFTPMPIEGIYSAKGHLETLYGRIRCEWEIKEDEFILEVDIPFNCEAVIRLPGGESHERGSGRHVFRTAMKTR